MITETELRTAFEAIATALARLFAGLNRPDEQQQRLVERVAKLEELGQLPARIARFETRLTNLEGKSWPFEQPRAATQINRPRLPAPPAESAARRGPGRPPGRKNNKTLLAEAEAAAANGPA